LSEQPRATGLPVQIAPSILSADFARLADEVARVEAGGADLLHVDVMDGHFVPNITIGAPVVAALKRVTKLPLEVHLMISDPDKYLGAFVDAGAATVIVHVEVLPHLHRTLQEIRRLGAKAGVAINPSTSMLAIGDVIEDLDHVLVMSVNPGFGGQQFIPRTYAKIHGARHLLAQTKREIPVEVDGGVSASNAAELVKAGVSILVAGNAIFGAPDAAAAVRDLRKAATSGLPRAQSSGR
jgi:ribulose-phosphate 3-epimerase